MVLNSIKNARHAQTDVKKGRMSVAKDTRRNTVRNFGKRVSYKYRPGTVVLSNYTRRLYYVVRRGKVISYPIATPRPNEVWSGSTKITKKEATIPTGIQRRAMREKNPNLPEKVAGGSRANPVWQARLVSWQFALSHPRYQPPRFHWKIRIRWLLPHAQQRYCQALAQGQTGYAGCCVDPQEKSSFSRPGEFLSITQ